MANKIIVIGGGPSGMMASIVARRQGSHVILLERNNRVGKKLLTTGNGRCNYTNLNLSINNYHGNDPSFVEKALSEFNLDKTLEFFESLGITPANEDNGKVYPLSFQASSMLDVLRYEMDFQGVELITEAFVSDLIKKKRFLIKLKDGRSFEADKVILATGGMAMPVSGSDGTGYSFSKSFGHSVRDLFPGLVQLKLEGSIFKQIDGVKFIGNAGIYSKGRLIVEDSGDILFTDYGISGPPILQVSRKAIELMNKGNEVEIRVSIISSKTKEELENYLTKRFKNLYMKNMEEALIGMINKKLILPILKELSIDKNMKASDISPGQIGRLAGLLTSWSFKIIGNMGWGQAQVTAGGVNTDEINHDTMESKLVKGLYIVGELLDIDGDCGGYNLQWAWSSAYLAGINASL